MDAIEPSSTTTEWQGPLRSRNLFAAFGDYHRAAYTHNTWAYTLLRQFHDQIETLIPPEDLYLAGWDKLIGNALRQ